MGAINNINTTKVQEKLDYWASQLRDMGRRNYLLFFKETKSSTLVIKEPNVLEIFDRLVIRNMPIYSPQVKENQKNYLIVKVRKMAMKIMILMMI